MQFQVLAEPFLLLGDIERVLRHFIARSFSLAEIKAAKHASDAEREIESASDLNFGEYKRLLEEPKNWQKLRIPLDRRVFCEHLERTRLIRNEVMHFDSDPFSPADLDHLRKFARFLDQVLKLAPRE